MAVMGAITRSISNVSTEYNTTLYLGPKLTSLEQGINNFLDRVIESIAKRTDPDYMWKQWLIKGLAQSAYDKLRSQNEFDKFDNSYNLILKKGKKEIIMSPSGYLQSVTSKPQLFFNSSSPHILNETDNIMIIEQIEQEFKNYKNLKLAHTD